MSNDTTLKKDIIAALIKEHDRLQRMSDRSTAEEERLRTCIEFITTIQRSDKVNAAVLKIETERPEGPLRL